MVCCNHLLTSSPPLSSSQSVLFVLASMCLVLSLVPFLCFSSAFFFFALLLPPVVAFALSTSSSSSEDFSAPSVTTLSSSTAVVSTLVQQYFYSPISVLVLSAIATVLIFAFLYQRYQSTAASPSTDSNIIVDSSTTLNMLKMRAKPKGETSAATGACRRKGGGGGGGAPPLTLKLDVLGKVHTIDYENQSLVDVS